MIMEKRSKAFIQHLGHDIEDEDKAYAILEKTVPLVGWVVMFFNSLEKSLDQHICEHISDRSDSLGLIVINGMHYNAKVEMFKRLCDDLHNACGKVPPTYKDLIENLKEAGRIRNSIVHADWLSTDEEGYTFMKMNITVNGMKQEYIQFSEESLNRFMRELTVYNHQLSDYSEQKGNLLSHGYCTIEEIQANQ